MRFVILPTILFLSACSGRVHIIPLPSEDCAPACERLHTLQCEEADDLPVCIEVCINAQENGFDMNLECVFESLSCAEFRICHEIDE